MILMLSKIRRNARIWTHKILSRKYLAIKRLLLSVFFFPQSTEGLIPDLHPELLSEGIESQRRQWLVT